MIISDGQLVRLGDEKHTSSPAEAWHPGGNILSLFGSCASYAAIYAAQTWVYTVVKKRAEGTARLPLKVYRRGDDDSRDEVRDHPYARLLRRPNPKMSSFLYWLWVSSTKDIYGEALTVKVRDAQGIPREMWPMHPANIDVRETDGRWRYVLRSNPDVWWSEDDVIHHRSFNPSSSARGLSPLEPLRQTLANEDAARRATSSFWARGARPGFALSHPGQLSEGAGKRLKAQFDSIAAGADNTGTTVVLEEGMTPNVLSLTAEEAQYIQTRQLNREEVCAAYDMPPTAVGILEHATYSNITEQLRSVYRDTLAPHLRGFEADLALQLAPDFRDDDVYAEFLMDEVLRGDFETRVSAWATAIQTGQATPAEARSAENRPYIDGSDQLMVNSAVKPVTLDTAVTRDQVDNVGALIRAGFDPDDARDAVGLPDIGHTGAKPVTTRDDEVRAVLNRVRRVQSLTDIDPTALVDGLNGFGDLVLEALDESADVPDFRARIKRLEPTHD